MKLTKLATHRKYARGLRGRRRFTSVDMAFLKKDEAADNSRVKRGELVRTNNRRVEDCGCGAEGCFIHRSW